MRKIHDEVLLEMLKEGKTQHEVVGHFGVSDAAICKRLQRLRSMQLPESFSKLTPQQQKFSLLKAGGANNLKAAQEAYDCGTKDSAKQIGYRLMKDPDINAAISDVLAQEGYPLRKRISRLGALIDCADLTIAGKGLDMSFKLDGSYAAEKHVVGIVDYRALRDEMAVYEAHLKARLRELEAEEVELVERREP